MGSKAILSAEPKVRGNPKNHSDKALNIKSRANRGRGTNATLSADLIAKTILKTHSDKVSDIKSRDNSEGVGRPSEPLSG